MSGATLPLRVQELTTGSFAIFTAACAQARAQGREVTILPSEPGTYKVKFA